MQARTFFRLLMICMCLVALSAVAQADTIDGVTFSLVNANLTGNPGNTLTWTYDVVNNSGGAIQGLFVNSGLWTGGTPNAGAFDGFGASGTINNGDSLEGPLFSFAADPGIQNSLNTGTFFLSILLNNNVVTLSENYSATISPAAAVPEPSSLAFLLAGLVLCIAVLRRA